MAKKNYVIDTSVFLSDANCIYKFGNADIFISLKVLEEIDKHKKRQDSVGFNARRIIKTLDELNLYLESQADIHLQQFIEAGRKDNLPFDQIYKNLRKIADRAKF